MMTVSISSVPISISISMSISMSIISVPRICFCISRGLCSRLSFPLLYTSGFRSPDPGYDRVVAVVGEVAIGVGKSVRHHVGLDLSGLHLHSLDDGVVDESGIRVMEEQGWVCPH